MRSNTEFVENLSYVIFMRSQFFTSLVADNVLPQVALLIGTVQAMIIMFAKVFKLRFLTLQNVSIFGSLVDCF